MKRTLIAGFVSLAALVALVVGVPILLARLVGWPLPHGSIDMSTVAHALALPIPESFWAKAFAAAGWVVWGWLVGSVAMEAVHLVRARDGEGSTRTSHRLIGTLVLKVSLAAAVLYGLTAHQAPGAAAATSAVPVPATTGTATLMASASHIAEPVGLGMSSAAAVLAIDRLRRVQQRRRPSGSTIVMPGPRLARAENSLRARLGGATREPEAATPQSEVVDALVTTATDVEGVPWRPVGCRYPQDIRDFVPEIEVAVMGPIEIRGGARAITRTSSRDLVVYLAMHPGGVEREVWAEAMWPGRIVPRTTLDSTVSVGRAALGCALDGSRHLPTGRGRLRLGAGVASDWEKFVSLSSAGTPEAHASEAHERRASALALIRGRLFDGMRFSAWAVCEGIAPSMESRIVDVATAHGEQCLASGDADGAQWAARQALKVSPYDERLYRILMRAADALGNRAGVLTAMEELRANVEDDVAPWDGVHPETEELFRALTGRTYPSSAPGPAGTSTAIALRESRGTMSRARSWVAASTT